MAIRNIVLDTDEMLRKKSREVTVFDQKLWQLLDDMRETMLSADGVGLAAVQVGILRKIVVIDIGDKLYEIINPEIISYSETQTGTEGCLSSPNQYGTVTRPLNIKVKAKNRHGKEYVIEGTELLARALCHEIDHLNGILFKDIATDVIEYEEEDEKPRRRRK